MFQSKFWGDTFLEKIERSNTFLLYSASLNEILLASYKIPFCYFYALGAASRYSFLIKYARSNIRFLLYLQTLTDISRVTSSKTVLYLLCLFNILRKVARYSFFFFFLAKSVQSRPRVSLESTRSNNYN